MKEEIRFLKDNAYMRRPKLLQLEITNRCPLECPQCYKVPDGGEDMDFDILSNILVDAASCNVKYLMINGGEPLLYYKFIEFMYLIKKYEFEAGCVTSGVGLSSDLISSIKRSGCYIQLNVSLNGSTEKINNLSRDGYNESIKAIKLLCENNFPYGINWVARKDNIYDFPNIVKLAKEYNASGITIATGKIDWDGEETSNLNEDDYRFISEFVEKNNVGKFIQTQYCFPLLNTLLSKNVNINRNQCSSGIYSCCVDVQGKYMPCIHLNYKEEYNSIGEYWTNSEVLKKVRSPNFGDYDKCKICSIKDICRNCFCMTKENSENLSLGMPDCPIYNLIKENRNGNKI